MLEPVIKKNDKRARGLIIAVSVIVFAVVAILGREKPQMNLSFDVHIFATINAVLNSLVAVILIGALIAVKQKKYVLHKQMMLGALILSVLFLVSYIAHHLLGGETKFGGEGTIKTVYFILLITHILLAAIILPFILFTTYRALTGEFEAHKKLAKKTFPIWLYVAITGPVVYFMISPYYH